MVHIMLVLCMVILSDSIDAEDVMTKLSPLDSVDEEEFGRAVCIYGETAFIGSPYDDNRRGSVYIFERQSGDGNWTFSQKIKASDASDYHYFGVSVSVYQETAIIGGYILSDSVYIFERQMNGTWIEIQKLTGSDTESGDQFGYAVTIYSDIAVISAPYDDDDGTDSGSVYIFQQQGNGEWIECQKLTASDGSRYSLFGFAVDISYNDTIFVGASEHEFGREGQVYIFERNSDNGTWIETAILSANSASTIDGFGYALSVYGNNLIIGAYEDSTSATYGGAAYIYTNTDGGIWKLNQTLFASNAGQQHYFGGSVSIYNETIVIGAVGAGSAYIFNKVSEGQWIETAKITADGLFGATVSIHDDDILIGAYNDDDEASESQIGAAYVMKNWNSCNKIWDESLINTTDRYLVNWQWTNCTFTALPTRQPTELPTAEPTTTEPTTASPTNAPATTASPTTDEPTTSESTTVSPTTSSPTTALPYTASPTTASPPDSSEGSDSSDSSDGSDSSSSSSGKRRLLSFGKTQIITHSQQPTANPNPHALS